MKQKLFLHLQQTLNRSLLLLREKVIIFKILGVKPHKNPVTAFSQRVAGFLFLVRVSVHV
jgi:hypothetical protein